MSRITSLFATLCALTLAGAPACLAQELSTEQEPPQQSSQQPVYYAVPSQKENVQYIVMPSTQAPQPQQTYVVTPQPQPQPQPYAITPKARPESRISFFAGLDVNFYASTDEFEEERQYRYRTDYEGNHTFDGNGFNAGLALGILFRDIAGLRGFVNIGEQSGESDYWNISKRKSNYHAESEVVDFAFGVSGTLFPFNRFKGFIYNTYIDASVGISLHEFEDEFAVDFGRNDATTSFFRLELGKLFPLSKYWNVGFGIAYVFENNHDIYEDSYEESSAYEMRHSFWAGVRFAFKRNKN